MNGSFFEFVLFVLTFPIFILSNVVEGLYILLNNLIDIFGQDPML